MLALDDGVPKIMSLKTIIDRYLDFHSQVIRRRTAYELKKAQDREHILEGLRKAVDIVDEISPPSAPARAALQRQRRPLWSVSALTTRRPMLS